MHTNSLRLMAQMLTTYAPDGVQRLAYDVGSFDVNGNYRELVQKCGWEYVGLDISAGPNVDVVIKEHDSWYPDPCEEKADLVISGQCMEHTKRPWEWILQVRQLMSDDAVLLLVVPAMWPIHRYPVDCWRILPDGMIALAEYAGLKCVETGTSPAFDSPKHLDCWAVMQK